MFLMPDKKWARLLAYVTGLANQKLLLQNEHLAAENRILRAHLPTRMRLSDPERSTLAEIGKRLGRPALQQVAGAIPSSPGTGRSLPANLTALNYVLRRAGPRITPDWKRPLSTSQGELRLGIRPHRRGPGQFRPHRFRSDRGQHPAPLRNPICP